MIMSKEKELNNQDQQDNKKQARRTFKTVVVTVICTLLAVIILLFVVILCLRGGCNKGSSNKTSSSTSQKYDFDNTKLDNIFKKIVSKQMLVDGFDADELSDVLAVTYSDNSGSFDLDISVRSTSNIYYYHLDNSTYTGYDNFVSYILEYDIDNKVGRPLDGEEVSISSLSIVNETLTTDKVCKYVISSNISGTTNYLDGFYFENNNYYVYQNKEVTNDNPFGETATTVIDSSNPLYPYYQSLNE